MLWCMYLNTINNRVFTYVSFSFKTSKNKGGRLWEMLPSLSYTERAHDTPGRSLSQSDVAGTLQHSGNLGVTVGVSMV